MSDSGNADDDPLAERFERVHSHLEHVDRNLELIAEQIEREIEDVMEDFDAEISYDIDDGTIEARLPQEKVVKRLNRRLEPPFFVKLEENTIVVGDIRDEFHESIDGKFLEGVRTERDETRIIKEVVWHLEESYEDGAPEQQLMKILRYVGLTSEEAEERLLELKTKGEVYEPSTGRLRTT